MMPQDSKNTTTESDIDENLFNLYPDPVHFVEMLKLFDRGDIASSIFVKLLEDYRNMKSQSNDESMRCISTSLYHPNHAYVWPRTLHKLQIIMQMQKQLSEGTTSNILRKPDQLLSFINHVLESSNAVTNNAGPSSEAYQDLEDGDSDDESPGSGLEIIGPDDELVETTITLLLSVLEGDRLSLPSIYSTLTYTQLQPMKPYQLVHTQS